MDVPPRESVLNQLLEQAQVTAHEAPTLPQWERFLSLVSARLTVRDEKLTLQQENLVHNERMASIGLMSAGIAHEINNPLAGLLLCIENIQTSATKPAVVSKNTDVALKLITRIRDIILSLKSLARDKRNDPMQVISLTEVFETIFIICKGRLSSHEINFVFDENQYAEILVRGRSGALSQVLLNLINNAFDAVQGQEKKTIKIDVRYENNQVSIHVIDSGPGIPEAVRHRIMDPFFTTKPAGQGTGLGLCIAQEIMKQHEGSLFLDSTIGKTCFTIQLPASLARNLVEDPR